MRVSFLLFLLPFLIFGCSKSEPENNEPKAPSMQQSKVVVFDVTKIAGKSKTEVEAIIGAPISCEPSKYGELCQFSKSNSEITFINGKADWITIGDLKSLSYESSAIESIGLPLIKPTFKNELVTRWENIPGYLYVSISPGEGGSILFAYIKVTTP